ncbi:hypothetical protein A1OW_13810 [Enterovibrio norvegicus]|nr:hypothetical protein A1OW_13810 [Enterovibrio norvegicus]
MSFLSDNHSIFHVAMEREAWAECVKKSDNKAKASMSRHADVFTACRELAIENGKTLFFTQLLSVTLKRIKVVFLSLLSFRSIESEPQLLNCVDLKQPQVNR